MTNRLRYRAAEPTRAYRGEWAWETMGDSRVRVCLVHDRYDRKLRSCMYNDIAMLSTCTPE
jgi:hypothetical protein